MLPSKSQLSYSDQILSTRVVWKIGTVAFTPPIVNGIKTFVHVVMQVVLVWAVTICVTVRKMLQKPETVGNGVASSLTPAAVEPNPTDSAYVAD